MIMLIVAFSILRGARKNSGFSAAPTVLLPQVLGERSVQGEKVVSNRALLLDFGEFPPEGGEAFLA